MHSPHITIFTPTYNRGYIIENLYRSLQRQEYFNFEWLVVDDGSSDNTEELFNGWIIENNQFIIRYYKTENGGKHRAVNKGLQLADGDIFFVVDSDDILTDDALLKVNCWFNEIKDSILIGIVANRGFSYAETVNQMFCARYLDKSLLEMTSYQENGQKVLDGERAIAIYTDIWRKYPSPEFNGENFTTEAVAYNRMAHDGYKVRFFNDIIYIGKYLDDGLTSQGNELFLKNPRGYGLWFKEKFDFEGASLFSRFQMCYTFTCDLSPRYDVQLIAEAIGTSKWIIRLMKLLHKIKVTII